MKRLGALLRDYGDAIEADLTERGINLWVDLGTRRLTWPRLRAILKHLGPTSALVRSVDPDSAGWDLHAYIAAAGVNNYGYAHGAKEPVVALPSEKAAQRRAAERRRRLEQDHLQLLIDRGVIRGN